MRTTELQIRHDTEKEKFWADVEAGQANLQYETVDDETLDFQSTFVPEPARHQGIGERLVTHALDWARENGYRVVPSCPFVRSVVEQTGDYDDLIAER